MVLKLKWNKFNEWKIDVIYEKENEIGGYVYVIYLILYEKLKNIIDKKIIKVSHVINMDIFMLDLSFYSSLGF